MAKRTGLGKGLDSIIPANKITNNPESQEQSMAQGEKAEENRELSYNSEIYSANMVSEKGVKYGKAENKRETSKEESINAEKMVKLTKIEPNREQPRKEFNEEALQELAESIKNHGIIQPLIVRQKGNKYEIVAGERRWRAARLAGLKEVPVVIKEYTDSEIAEIALVENLQREDLNPIEEAMAYQRLLNEFNLKQEEVAFRVSKSRSVITNSLRLLKLHPEVQEMLSDGLISTGHGKVLLSLDNPEQQLQIAQEITTENLSVRQTEERVRSVLNPPVKKEKKELGNTLVYQDLEDKLRQCVNSKVNIHRINEKKGKIEISYSSLEELERIAELMGVKY